MDTNIYYIIGMFKLQNSIHGQWIADAADLATKAINANDTILNGIRLLVHKTQETCEDDSILNNFIDIVLSGHHEFKKFVGILGKFSMRKIKTIVSFSESCFMLWLFSGPWCSDSVEPLLAATGHFRTVTVSYSAEGSMFSDREKYPYFFRTIGDNSQFK